VRGGSGWGRFRRRGAEGWTRSGRRASGGDREARADFGGARRKKRKQAREGGVRVGFEGDSTAQLMGERAVTGGAQDAGGAGVSSGHAWRPFGLGGATWQGEGRTAEAARAVGGGWGDAWMGGAVLQKLGKRPAAEIGDPRKMMEDLNAKSEKGRDPSVKHR
jgi:hypothetical protein